MQQGVGDSYYPQFHHHQPQPLYQTPTNPAPNPNSFDPYSNIPPPYPVASSASAPDYPNYPPFPHDNSDHALNPTAPSFIPPQFTPDQSHIPPYFPYDHTQAPVNPQYTSSAPYYTPYDDAGAKFDQNNVYDSKGYGDDGVYRYEGPGKVEPYGARGTSGLSSSSSGSGVMFDDYGRPISTGNANGFGSGNGNGSGVRSEQGAKKVVRAVPKEDTEGEFQGGGAQKFRVKVLSEGYGQTDLDVLCQVGLDGIRMLDPATSRTLRIYPFDAVTRWEVLDSYIFAFWAKMPVDVEPKRTRLKSNSYTTNTILDTVTAASVQVKEIAERRVPDSSKSSEQLAEKKKGFDWMNLVKPPIEEKDHWVPDEAVKNCSSCGTNFNAFVRRHHCRNCGEIFCDKCTQGRTPLTSDDQAPSVRVCDRCMAEVTQRLDNVKEADNRGGTLLSHEDLAKQLKEEMSRNSKASSGSKYEVSQTQKREVACPTCTVHLQVDVPSTGSETIECSVCQHPFLVSAN